MLEARPDLRWPADLYLEGSDQHRGWFHTSLLTAVGTRGRAPYSAVLTHGFVVDAEGRKMSKSLGNVIAPREVIEKYGAEILRLWVSAADYRDDIRISDEILAQLSEAYRRIRNTARFLLGNLSDFDPATDAVPAAEHAGDRPLGAAQAAAACVEKARRAYDGYEFHLVYHALHNFCAVDLSALYLDILKDRLYTSPAASRERRSAQTVLHALLDALARLMAPILSFTAEEIWQHMPAAPGKAASIHLALLPAVDAALVDADLAERWELLLRVRGEVTKALEEARAKKEIGHALDAAVTIAAGRRALRPAGALCRRAARALHRVGGRAGRRDGGPGGRGGQRRAARAAHPGGRGVRCANANAAGCTRPAWARAPSTPGICDRCLMCV